MDTGRDSTVILECDIGNTRCKWRMINADGAVVERGALENSDGFSQLPDLASVARVRVASVAAESINNAFLKMFTAVAIVPEFARSEICCAGLRNNYENPQRLGIDRWLAVIAAHKRCAGAALVIDVGSALNIELVSAEGEYLGGYITPGWELMKKALLSDTGLVRFGDIKFSADLDFGLSTVQSVSGGISAALVGASRVAIDRAAQYLPEGFSVFLTGGGAGDIHSQLSGDVELVSDLVMDGLSWVLP